MAIAILAAPNLRTSYMKIAERLKGLYCDSLFLNFPENLEPLVRDLVENRLSYRAFIEEIRKRKLVPEPINGWRYTAEPLLKSLIEAKLLKSGLQLYCYKDVNHNMISANIAGKIALLTFRANMTGKINIEDWKKIFNRGIYCEREALRKEVDSIDEKASHECSCVSGLGGENLGRCLTERGHSVSLTNIEEFYHPTPLEILEERMAKEDMPNEEVEELIREHLEYVKDYILKSKNRDQAYYQWVYDKVPSLRPKIDSEEIKHLDAFLHPDDV